MGWNRGLGSWEGWSGCYRGPLRLLLAMVGKVGMYYEAGRAFWWMHLHVLAYLRLLGSGSPWHVNYGLVSHL
jgi:hypothetical protein